MTAPYPEPKLGRPGAGLPAFEAWLMRSVLFPYLRLSLSWEKANRVFRKEGERILSLVEPLSDEDLLKPVLIRRIRGIEDSSRFWSAGMVLRHLIIVGDHVRDFIVTLSRSRIPLVKADIAAVKPPPVRSRSVVSLYQQFLDSFQVSLEEKVENIHSPKRHEHPWFGALNAHEWACLAAAHQKIHRRQIEEIIKGL